MNYPQHSSARFIKRNHSLHLSFYLSIFFGEIFVFLISPNFIYDFRRKKNFALSHTKFLVSLEFNKIISNSNNKQGVCFSLIECKNDKKIRCPFIIRSTLATLTLVIEWLLYWPCCCLLSTDDSC